ncbi:MAG: hypothetical protein J0I20_09990 [Chloroflexi bacterium]|nr:hypothetical protein [Chloroflexota bacterium]OJV94571.1 MAG: hypothetical protein BGO39_22820 [Chloroflexi bacterium 54-19]
MSLPVTPSEETQASQRTRLKFAFKPRVTIEIILIGSIVFLGCLIRLINGPQPIDDAYITYRYVENIVSGNGFVYNIGEHVLGTTTPFYTLLLSLLFFIFRIDLPWLSLIINTAADAVTIILLWRISKHFLAEFETPAPFEFVTPLLFSITAMSTNWCIGGMETSVFSFLLISSLYFFTVRNSAVLTAITASLAVICRPEGIVLLGLILAYILIFQRRGFLKTLLVVIITSAPWLLFATFYFGNLIPQSIIAKNSATYVVYNDFIEDFSVFWQLLADNPIGHLIGRYTSPSGFNTIMALMALINFPLYLYGTLKFSKLKDRKYLLIPGFAFAFIGIYGLSIYKTPSLIFPWYTGPLAPWLLLLLTVCLAGLWQHLRKLPKLLDKFVQIMVISFLIISVINQLHGYNNGRSYIKTRGYYEQAAIFLRPYLKKDDLIAAPEIGELGYFTKARIMDTVGLVSPEVLKFYPVPVSEQFAGNTIPTNLIIEYQPDYVVGVDIFMRNSLLKSLDFLKDYTLFKSWSDIEANSNKLLIFVKNSTLNK